MSDSIDRIDAGIEIDSDGASAHEQRLLDELYDIIVQEWSYHTRARIGQLRPATNRSTVIIEFDPDTETGKPETLLGGYTEALLKHGWAVTAWKGNMIFVSRIVETAEDGVAYRFEGYAGEINRTYGVKACDVCEERERTQLVYAEPDDGGEDDRAYVGLCDRCDLPDGIAAVAEQATVED